MAEISVDINFMWAHTLKQWSLLLCIQW